jgi:hypothetical protein
MDMALGSVEVIPLNVGHVQELQVAMYDIFPNAVLALIVGGKSPSCMQPWQQQQEYRSQATSAVSHCSTSS